MNVGMNVVLYLQQGGFSVLFIKMVLFFKKMALFTETLHVHFSPTDITPGDTCVFSYCFYRFEVFFGIWGMRVFLFIRNQRITIFRAVPKNWGSVSFC